MGKTIFQLQRNEKQTKQNISAYELVQQMKEQLAALHQQQRDELLQVRTRETPGGILVYNGLIWDHNHNYQEAIFLLDGKIKAIGSLADVETHCVAETKRIDAMGNLVLSGFHDSHMHLHGMSDCLRQLDLSAITSISQLIALGKTAIQNMDEGVILRGRGWNQDYFMEKRLPTRHDLDEISLDRPIVLIRACGHVLVCNSAVLRAMGIAKDHIPVMEGGQFDLDEMGKLTGIVREHAMGLVYDWLPKQSIEDMKQDIKEGIAHANRYGITAIQTNDINGEGADMMYKAYQNLSTLGQLDAEIYHQCCFMDLKDFKRVVQEGLMIRHDNSFNRAGPLKLFVDGSLGARTALLRQPYADDASTSGMLCLTRDELNDLVAYANEYEIQVAIHAIGDMAMEMVLEAYENVIEVGNPLRHGIVHCQITDHGLLERMADMKLIAYVQPVFLHYDQHIVTSRVGESLASTSYAFHTMEEMGIVSAYGSDSPVEHCNPLLGIHCAVTRSDLNDGQTAFYIEEAVAVASAIEHYTKDGAFASFQENYKGQLAVGFDADVIILDQNILECDPHLIKDTNVQLTIAMGKVVYHSDTFSL